MKNESDKPKIGRPLAPIDEKHVRDLARRLWTNLQIAAHFGVSPDLISRRFGAIIREEKEKGKAYIRDLQWRKAEEGDTKMILHMSAHHLDEHSQQHLKLENITEAQLIQLVQAKLLSAEQQGQLPASADSEQDSQSPNSDSQSDDGDSQSEDEG